MATTTGFLITGAGKGIGRAIAQELIARARASNDSSDGAFAPRLFLTARTAADLAALQAEAGSARVAVATCAAELSKLDEIGRVHREAEKFFGGAVDCLVNNAGVGRFGDLGELTEDDFDHVLATNLKGTFFLTQRVFAGMRKAGHGHVIFVTSVAAETPFEQSAIYCMSKAGQKSLADVLRLYGRKCGVRVTNVMPGATETPMWGPLDETMRARMMQPEDVARMIVEAALLPERASVEEIVIRPVTGDL